MSPIARDNHFIPQSYLRGWSEDGLSVSAYQTLVPDQRLPAWSQRPIKGVAYQRDLYTVAVDGQEVDEFERWLGTTFEDPAAPVLERVRNDEDVSPSDFETLALFFAAQDIRTPAAYLDAMVRWQRELPEMIEAVLEDVIAEFAAGGPVTEHGEASDIPAEFRAAVQVRTEPNPEEEDKAWLGAAITAGRSLWLTSMRQLLTGDAVGVLTSQRWSIASPYPGTEWFTSDHPALKLNFRGIDDYDFGGGWGIPGVDLILPLSPRHLLMTTVGRPRAPRLQLTVDQTMHIQRFLAERAHRWVFARRAMSRVSWWRKRRVNDSEYKAEQAAWNDWHASQTAAEVDVSGSGPTVAS